MANNNDAERRYDVHQYDIPKDGCHCAACESARGAIKPAGILDARGFKVQEHVQVPAAKDASLKALVQAHFEWCKGTPPNPEMEKEEAEIIAGIEKLVDDKQIAESQFKLANERVISFEEYARRKTREEKTPGVPGAKPGKDELDGFKFNPCDGCGEGENGDCDAGKFPCKVKAMRDAIASARGFIADFNKKFTLNPSSAFMAGLVHGILKGIDDKLDV